MAAPAHTTTGWPTTWSTRWNRPLRLPWGRSPLRSSPMWTPIAAHRPEVRRSPSPGPASPGRPKSISERTTPPPLPWSRIPRSRPLRPLVVAKCPCPLPRDPVPPVVTRRVTSSPTGPRPSPRSTPRRARRLGAAASPSTAPTCHQRLRSLSEVTEPRFALTVPTRSLSPLPQAVLVRPTSRYPRSGGALPIPGPSRTPLHQPLPRSAHRSGRRVEAQASQSAEQTSSV